MAPPVTYNDSEATCHKTTVAEVVVGALATTRPGSGGRFPLPAFETIHPLPAFETIHRNLAAAFPAEGRPLRRTHGRTRMTKLCEQPSSAAPREDAPGLMLAALCACALAQGIAVITVTYDGYGDEGQIQDVTLGGAMNEVSQIADEMAMPEVACASWAVPYRGDATPIETTFKVAIDDLALEMLSR